MNPKYQYNNKGPISEFSNSIYLAIFLKCLGAGRETPNLEIAGSNPILSKVLLIRALFLFFSFHFIKLFFVVLPLVLAKHSFASVFTLRANFWRCVACVSELQLACVQI